MAEQKRFLAFGYGCAIARLSRRLVLCLAVLGGLLAWHAAPCAATTITLTDLGADFQPMDIDIEGRVTGRRISTSQAAIWEAGVFTDLGTLAGGSTSVGNAIYQGEVVGTSGEFVGTGAFHYDGFTHELTVPSFTGSVTGVDINANGQKLGTVIGSGFKFVGIWDASDTFTAGILAGNVTAYAFNDAGDGVGSNASGGVYWNGSSPTAIAKTYTTFDPSGGINNDRVIGGVLNGTTAATVKFGAPGNPTAIPNITNLGSTSAVTGINNVNELVGNTNTTVFYYNRDTGALVDLNTATFSGAMFDELIDVQAISDPGIIVGTGLIGGVVHAFKADLMAITVVGDFNGDGFVNEGDYTRWRKDYGVLVDPAGAGADGNSDGIVDAADYTVWRNAFGNGSGGGGMAVEASGAVPEPCAIGLLVLGTLLAGLSRRTFSRTRVG